MSLIRPLLRSAALRAPRPLHPAAARAPRRSLVTPTHPVNATVSNVTVEHVKEDPAEAESGEHLASAHPESGDEMFGFKLNPVSTKTGGNAKSEGRPIYLDMQATTPMDPRVLDKMLPLFTEQFGNPHSRTHAYGWEAEKAVDEARQHVASLVGAHEKDIVFTSGATESNNMIIKGIAKFHQAKRRHIITTQTEHKCVLDSCRWLSTQGFEVTYLPVLPNGLVSLQELKSALRPDTSLVSIMAVNNEIGVIQPLAEISATIKAYAKEKGIPKAMFHTDAAQAVGKINIDVEAMGIDAMSISGHKIYGPKGVGAAYVRRRPRVRLEPLIHGGGQERGLRSGTVPAPIVVGLGEACRIAKQEMAADHERIKELSDRLINGITSQVDMIVRNGDPSGYPGCVNLSFSYVEGESLLMALKDIALSSGSACTSASLEPSYVLRALGAAEDMAHSSLRFGIGRFTTEEEIDMVVERIVSVVNRLRDMSPLWEMVQEGIDISKIEWSAH
ncbi:cysteine desulfurase IscS [Cryptococcus amylolentus CBS 6039]|uniref:cysteine desulfurase n=2 Tax=Cryptococcus amylolentus TaxID=104669 RepID=A0A1E3HHQ8_9TREE|nr:cysteine desulfurase IscS [Cryptococcus amylolentus CBS 6039]ODN75286.1 cysteine desulfurase IscS [Cryptococcus amylolentus CBS 6039]